MCVCVCVWWWCLQATPGPSGPRWRPLRATATRGVASGQPTSLGGRCEAVRVMVPEAGARLFGSIFVVNAVLQSEFQWDESLLHSHHRCRLGVPPPALVPLGAASCATTSVMTRPHTHLTPKSCALQATAPCSTPTCWGLLRPLGGSCFACVAPEESAHAHSGRICTHTAPGAHTRVLICRRFSRWE